MGEGRVFREIEGVESWQMASKFVQAEQAISLCLVA